MFKLLMGKKIITFLHSKNFRILTYVRYLQDENCYVLNCDYFTSHRFECSKEPSGGVKGFCKGGGSRCIKWAGGFADFTSFYIKMKKRSLKWVPRDTRVPSGSATDRLIETAFLSTLNKCFYARSIDQKSRISYTHRCYFI